MPEPPDQFRALVLERVGEKTEAQVRLLGPDDLPEGEVLVRTQWSALNYKDALALTNRGRIIRTFPMVPGIDLAGTVLASTDDRYEPGECILVTGYGTGEEHWGGYAERNRVAADWLVPIAAGWDARRAMAVGTAGFTAMLGVMALEEHGLGPDAGEVIVTGAAGGVGSFAVALLAAQGYRVVASTGRPELAAYLTALGASAWVGREVLATTETRPLRSERWAGGIDTVGGTTLANMMSAIRRHGSIAVCGLVAGADLVSTVYPLILRGVNLLGIDSNYCPRSRRLDAWRRLASELPPKVIERVIDREIGLEDVAAASSELLDGRVRGRVLVDLAR